MIDEGHISANSAERKRLYALTGEVRDMGAAGIHTSPLGNLLVHLAYWDFYYLALLEDWDSARIGESDDVDAVNQAVQHLAGSIPLDAAIQLVRHAADAVDGKVEGISATLSHEIESSGHTRAPWRSLHRREHLDELQELLHASA